VVGGSNTTQQRFDQTRLASGECPARARALYKKAPAKRARLSSHSPHRRPPACHYHPPPLLLLGGGRTRPWRARRCCSCCSPWRRRRLPEPGCLGLGPGEAWPWTGTRRRSSCGRGGGGRSRTASARRRRWGTYLTYAAIGLLLLVSRPAHSDDDGSHGSICTNQQIFKIKLDGFKPHRMMVVL
jgi:hypothetical protein